MNNLQVKNVPARLHQRLRAHARARQSTLRDIVLSALERELARADWHKRLAERPTTELGVSAASLLEEDREQRSRERA